LGGKGRQQGKIRKKTSREKGSVRIMCRHDTRGRRPATTNLNKIKKGQQEKEGAGGGWGKKKSSAKKERKGFCRGVDTGGPSFPTKEANTTKEGKNLKA